MSQVDNLLNGLGSDEIALYSAEPETEGHIVIGKDRFITVPEGLKRLAVEHDHDVETVTFDCPRYWDEHDLSQLRLYVNYMRPDGSHGACLVEDIEVEDDIFHFTWTISKHVTEYKGNITFLICARRVGNEGIEELCWHSEPNRDCYISEGIECVEPIVAQYPDIIEQLLTRMETAESVAATADEKVDTFIFENDGIPHYVRTEADKVIDRVLAAQGNRTFTFAAISDMHYGNGSDNYTDGIKHACQAMKYIDERIKLDAVAVLGDYTNGYLTTSYDDAISDYKGVNSLLNNLRFVDNLRQKGNHDAHPDYIPLTNRFIQSYSDNVVWGDKANGYFYKDFDGYKLRVICINANENNTLETNKEGELQPTGNISCSTTQYKWFASSLDLTAKEDVADWQILILSHQPLDWYYTDGTYAFAKILDAYKNGASGTTGGVSYDFTNKNSAQLVGNIHGHIHNFLTDYINKQNVNTPNPTEVIRMATPESCINRANRYTGNWKEEVSYPKTQNTERDTSFVIYCIDLDTYTINAICYGAGIDRTVKYSTGEIITSYKIINNLTNITNSNTVSAIKSGESYSATLTVTEGELASVVIMMGGVEITSTAYSDGTISIPSVTGNVVITAIAKVEGEPEQPEEPDPPVEPDEPDEPIASYTNLIPLSKNADGTPYADGKGYKENTRLSSTGAESTSDATGTSVTGFIDVAFGDVIYLKNINYKVGVNSVGDYLVVYKDNHELIASVKSNTFASHAYLFTNATTDSEGNLTSFKLGDGSQNYRYLRMSAKGLGADAIITKNESIE